MDPSMRAGDADRDATISTLREAYAQGRLTQGEFDTRSASAHAATTYGDLAALTADLPSAASPSLAAAAAADRVPGSDLPSTEGDRSSLVKQGWWSWVVVAVITNAIWLFTGFGDGTWGATYYWPFWVLVPWGVVILVGTIAARVNRTG